MKNKREEGRPQVLSATTLIGDQVENPEGDDLGKIEDLVIDIDKGRIAYAVLSFGGFLGMGDKLFAIPWDAVTIDLADKKCILDVDKETLKNAPGFDKDNWPDMADQEWGTSIYEYYDIRPYWRSSR